MTSTTPSASSAGGATPVGRHRDKVRQTAADALSELFDGARIMVGGFGLCGNAEALIAAVVDSGKRDLTIISNNAGNLGKGLATWLRAGIVRKVICTYIGNNKDLHAMMAAGTVEVEVNPQGTFVERMRAAGAGLAGFYTPTGVGTVVADGKEVREFDGRAYVLERALSADFALIRARRGDRFGNLRFWRTARNFSPIMATAARTTIAEVDELVEIGDLDPDDVHLPGVFVHGIVEVRDHEDPFEYRTTRPRPSGAQEDGDAV
jgi:3-oxoacid CoA-transferase subunit A